MRPALPLLALLAIAGCVAPPKTVAPPRVVAPPRPVPTASAPLPTDWRDWPLTAGNWFYRAEGGTTLALFGPANAEAVVSLSCDLARHQVTLLAPGPTAASLTLRTSTAVRTLRAVPSGDQEQPRLTATLAASDPILDAVAFSRGRWTVEQPGRPPLVLPAWAEVERVIEDCRP